MQRRNMLFIIGMLLGLQLSVYVIGQEYVYSISCGKADGLEDCVDPTNPVKKPFKPTSSITDCNDDQVKVGKRCVEISKIFQAYRDGKITNLESNNIDEIRVVNSGCNPIMATNDESILKVISDANYNTWIQGGEEESSFILDGNFKNQPGTDIIVFEIGDPEDIKLISNKGENIFFAEESGIRNICDKSINFIQIDLNEMNTENVDQLELNIKPNTYKGGADISDIVILS